jgi:hypothetical protein
MVPSLDGVMHVAVVTDLIVRRRTAWGKLVPSLLPRFSTPSPRAVGAAARGAIAASSHQWGAHVGAVPIGGGRQLGRPRGCSIALGR